MQADVLLVRQALQLLFGQLTGDFSRSAVRLPVLSPKAASSAVYCASSASASVRAFSASVRAVSFRVTAACWAAISASMLRAVSSYWAAAFVRRSSSRFARTCSVAAFMPSPSAPAS